MSDSWIDNIQKPYFQWLYKDFFPKDFDGTVLLFDPFYLVKLKNFLTSEECEEVIEIAKGKYTKSTIIHDGKLVNSSTRTSQTVFLTENAGYGNKVPLFETILKRVCILTSCQRSQIEGLMIVKYEEGEEFQEHWDYFEPGKDDIALKNGGQRIATFFIWLNDMEKDDGGGTYFPKVDIYCVPDAGAALFWLNQYGDKLLSETSHCGTPVLKGTKYGMNIWIRYPGWTEI